MDCSPSGSSLHGILQARILEWVAISFSNHQPRQHIKKQRHYFANTAWHAAVHWVAKSDWTEQENICTSILKHLFCPDTLIFYSGWLFRWLAGSIGESIKTRMLPLSHYNQCLHRNLESAWRIPYILTVCFCFCFFHFLSSVQFSSVPQLCLTLCDPVDCST